MAYRQFLPLQRTVYDYRLLLCIPCDVERNTQASLRPLVDITSLYGNHRASFS